VSAIVSRDDDAKEATLRVSWMLQMGEQVTGKTSHNTVPPAALGKFVPFARLGQGGMADVFLAVARGPVGFNKLVVVKRLRNMDDPMHVEMFLDEARLSARLSHPNIVNTYEVGEAKGQYFIAMEYLEGQPLQTLLTTKGKKGEKLEQQIAAFIAMQALKGLHYAHDLTDYDGTPLEVVHRDVSPHNLFLTYQGEVKLLDFGIAKAQVNMTRTETGVLKGKIRYMSPEQMSDKNVDRRADVYALGVVLWEALAGKPLYTGDVASITARINADTAPPIRDARPDVAPELEAIVTKALLRDLDARYQSADAMRADLERYLWGKLEAPDQAVARIVNETFAETRDGVRARIKAFLAELPEPTSGVTSTPDLAEAADLLPTLFGDGSGNSGSGSGNGGRMSSGAIPLASGKVFVPTQSASVSRSTPAPKPRSRAALWIVAGGAAVIGVGFFAAQSLRASAPATSTPAAPPAVSPAPVSSTTPVHIVATPEGARVEYQGRTVGTVPLDLPLPPGPQTLTVALDGYEPQTLTIDVQPNTPTARAVMLRAKAEAAPGASNAANGPPRGAAIPRGWTPPTRTPPPTTATAPATASAPRPKIRVVDDDNSP